MRCSPSLSSRLSIPRLLGPLLLVLSPLQAAAQEPPVKQAIVPQDTSSSSEVKLATPPPATHATPPPAAPPPATPPPATHATKKTEVYHSDSGEEVSKAQLTDTTQEPEDLKAEQAIEKREVELAIEERTYKPWLEVKDTKFDWIRTTSGEWLKGELKNLRDETLTIDSDEFDMQDLDWEDISDIHSPNRFIYVLKDGSIFTGPAELAAGKLIVETKEGSRIFDRHRLMTIVPEHESELSKWSFKLTVGATASYGNSEVIDYSAYSRLRRESAFHRGTLEYNGAYGLVSTEENTNKHRGNAIWNIFVSPVFYITPYYGELLYDKFRNIEYQSLTATGAGLHAIKAKSLTLDVDLSGGYIAAQYITTESADEKREQGWVAIPRIVFEWDITNDVEFELEWKTVLRIDDIKRSFHQGTSRLEIDITDAFDFDVSADYSRQESPVANEAGDVPKKDDLKVTVGIGLEFE